MPPTKSDSRAPRILVGAVGGGFDGGEGMIRRSSFEKLCENFKRQAENDRLCFTCHLYCRKWFLHFRVKITDDRYFLTAVIA